MITCIGLSPALDVTYRVGRLVPGGIHRPHEVLALPGGKSLNAARAATRLGGSVRAIALLGGFTGARVRSGLEKLDGITVQVIDTTAETRSCVTVFDDAGGATEFYEVPPEVDAVAWAALEAAVDAVPSGWLAFSGSVPPGEAVERTTRLVTRTAARGIHVAVDTHGDMLRAMLDRGGAALIKVNRHEAAAAVGGGDADADELAKRLHGTTGALAIVTDGAAPAAASGPSGTWRVSPPQAGAFAVGSGDCFLAGLLVSLDSHPADLPRALRLATAAAAANTLSPGAAVFDVLDLDRLQAAVSVRVS